MELVARAYDTSRPIWLRLQDGRVAEARTVPEERHAAALPWVAPGLVDIQVNGYGGQEFSSLDLTPERVAEIARQHDAWGVTAFCPTLTTQSFACLAHGLGAIARACESDREVQRLVWGIHLEGPYFCPEDGPRGAHPREHCRRPDWDEFLRLQEAAGGRIRILTMSPEFEEAPAFISRAAAAGVVVALGHMGATAEQIRAAVDAGARLSTHLGNGAHRMLPRHPNYLWDQLAEDRLLASLIVDGHHLPPEVVKVFVRAKTPERLVLVSDLSGLAGLPPGRYTSSGCEVEILDDGRLVIAGQQQLLAGASRPLGMGVINVMRYAGVDLATAIAMASARPACLLGRRCGGLRPGDPAELVLFDLRENPPEFSVRATIAGGRVVAGSLPAYQPL
jgi:N-acetylglucosamine-6-phosphate deacetylase